MRQGDAIVPTDQQRTTLLSDVFTDDVDLGAVVGGTGPQGAIRTGVDVEGRIGADNGALRIKPLRRPGWGREGIAYGPFDRKAGLVMGVHLLNGHHASQTFVHDQTPVERLKVLVKTLLQRKRPIGRHHENLAVGFFTDKAPRRPLRQGHGLVMHSATADNGELWAGAGGAPLRVTRPVRNLPLAAYVALRDVGAVYYAATLPEDPALPALPWVRPVALDPTGSATDLYAGVHQRILGEVGYRVDSRVWEVEVAHVPSLAHWYGGACLADRLTGSGPLGVSGAEEGGPWTSWSGDMTRTGSGVKAHADATAALDAGTTVGLVHAQVTVGRRGQQAGILWRASSGGRTSWRVLLGARRAELVFTGPGGQEAVASASVTGLRPGTTHSVQVVDDGKVFSVHVDGAQLFGRWFDDDRSADGTGVGVAFSGEDGAAAVSDLEAHPRLVRAPLLEKPTWPPLPAFGPPVFDEVFDTVASDLDGTTTPSGGREWSRIEGAGRLTLTEEPGARVDADPDRPNPGRTIYAVDWEHWEGVDLSVSVVPPGTDRGQRHNGRCGLVIWQDAENYLVVNTWLDDWLVGTSVSTFYRVRGHEDMYDAVWTLTGETVTWGVPHTLRVAFDGYRFIAYLNGEPVLYRAVRDVYPDAPRLIVHKVAIIANEEWGDDTGTLFQRVVAAAPLDERAGSTS